MALFRKTIVPTACALLSSTALSLSVNRIDAKSHFLDLLLKEADGIGLDKFIVFIALSFLFIKAWERFQSQSDIVTHLLSALLSVLMLIGQSYASLGNWGFIFASRAQFAVASVAFSGYFILFDVCLTCLYGLLLSNKFRQLSKRSFPAKIEKHYTLFVFCAIVLCWLPYLLPNLPGSVYNDGFLQLDQAFGIKPLTNHHSWVLSVVYGLLMRLGRTVSDNFGIFTVIFSMLLLQAMCYALVCRKIKGWGSPFALNVISLAFFALIPPFGAYAQVLIKDCTFSALFALFFALYIDICLAYVRKKPLKSPKKAFTFLLFVELAVCLTRQNGIHIVLPADLLLLAFTVKGKKIYSLAFTLCLAFAFFFVQLVIAPAAGVKPSPKTEMLSIPFQQTARYLKEYPNDVTEKERKAIDTVLDFDKAAKRYNPELADPVNLCSRPGKDIKKVADYFLSAWFPMLCRHPGVYIESFLNNTFGYYYPFSNREARYPYIFYIDKNKDVNTGYFKVKTFFPKGRKYVLLLSNIARRLPGLSQAVNPGTYVWMLLIISGFLLYCRQYRKVFALAALFLQGAVLIASPPNGYLRLALPLLACAPVMFFWCTEHLFLADETPHAEAASPSSPHKTASDSF